MITTVLSLLLAVLAFIGFVVVLIFLVVLFGPPIESFFDHMDKLATAIRRRIFPRKWWE